MGEAGIQMLLESRPFGGAGEKRFGEHGLAGCTPHSLMIASFSCWGNVIFTKMMRIGLRRGRF